MKTLRYFNLAALAVAAMFATACGGDDNKGNNTNTLKEDGASCSANSECKSGKCGEDKKCAEKPGATSDKKANGEKCTKAEDCQSGYCNDDEKCAEKPGGTQTDKKENGEKCTKAEDCKSGYCGEDEKCAEKSGGTGTGIIDENSLAELGKPCSTDSECKSKFCNMYSAVCVNEADKDKKLELGKSCQSNSYCESDNCVNFKCVDKNGTNGSFCDDMYDCDSYYCNEEGKCEAFSPQPNGEACFFHEDCASGWCSGGSGIGVCTDKEPQENGEPCKVNAECNSNYCDKGTMKCDDKPAAVEQKENGEACETHINCKSNYCNADSKCAEEPKGLPRGASCSSDSQCSTNSCYNKVCTYREYSQGFGEACDKSKDCGYDTIAGSIVYSKCIDHKCWHGLDDLDIIRSCQNAYKCGYGNICKLNGYYGSCKGCTQDSECAADYGSDFKCRSGKCALGKAGDTCTKDSECESKVCLAGTNRCAIVNYEDYKCKSDSDCESKGTGLACAKAVELCVLNDTCKDVQCGSEEVCYMGRCVHSAKEGDACNSNEKSFCLLNKIVSCVDGHYVIEDCKAKNLGNCSVFGDDIACVGAMSYSTAVCAYIKQHTTTGSNGIGEACSTDKSFKYGVMCQEDVNGWLFARPNGEPTECGVNKKCIITEGDDLFAATASCVNK